MKSNKVELDLNNKQQTACLQYAGTARWAYNWGLQRKREAYAAGKKTPTAIDLHKELCVLKKTQATWLYSISKCVPQNALRNLDRAFDNFFQRCRTKARKKGFPKFKSRKRGIGSFTLDGSIHVTDKTIQLPRLGKLRLKERGYIPTKTQITSATVSERAGHWFVAVHTTEPTPQLPLGKEVLGVDVGINHLAVLSDGTKFENPRALHSAQHRLRLLQKTVSRQLKGGANRRKAVQQLARQHYRIACIRQDAIHKATTAIAKRAAAVGIESLNVAAMLKNHYVAGGLADASLAEFHRQLVYKMQWHGGRIIKANRFFPSSKKCSMCGSIKKRLPISVRIFQCKCGLKLDRDLNAAINLRNLAASSAVTAYCPGTASWVGTRHCLGLVS